MKKVAAVVLIIFGLTFAVSGIVAWNVTGNQLAQQKIVVAEDAAPVFGMDVAGKTLDGPVTAFGQAQIIEAHALEATGGKQYAEMDREDPMRAVAASAASLRTSLFASVMAFGVSALAVALGVVLVLTGAALRNE